MNLQSIKTRLILFAAAMVVASMAFRFLFALPFATEQLRELVAKEQLSSANYIAADIEDNILSRRGLIRQLADTVPQALLREPAALRTWLQERQLVNPMFDDGLILISADGQRVLADYPAVPGRDQLGFTDTEWFTRALASDKAVIGKPQRGRITGTPILIMAAAVRNAQHQVVAVLAGSARLDAPGFLGRMQQHSLGKTGGFLLISPSDQLFVGASDRAMILTPTPKPGVNLLHDKAMAGFRGTGETVNAKGAEEFSAMSSVPSTGWFVVVRMPTKEAFQPITALRDFLLPSGVALLMLMIAAMIIVLPRWLRPLEMAARAMRDMADGKRPLAPLPIEREDEVGSLLRGFNHLVQCLNEKEAALAASEAHMSYIAHHDSLTGLYNRAMLEDHLQHAIARAQRDETHFALLFCDLDGFKPVNDVHGHDVGDLVLKEVAQRLARGRRAVDTVARQGGDEFVILLADLDDPRANAEAIARVYLADLAETYAVAGLNLCLSASIGIALYQGKGMTASQLMSRADHAMYQAKRAGKNQLCLFDASNGLVGA